LVIEIVHHIILRVEIAVVILAIKLLQEMRISICGKEMEKKYK